MFWYTRSAFALLTVGSLLCGCSAEQHASSKTVESRYAKCFSRSPKGDCTSYSPSLIELIVHPDWYDGREVILSGVLSTKMEDQALYVSTEDLQHVNSGASVWIDAEKTCRDCPDLDGQWVVVSGVFRADVEHASCRGGFVKARVVARHEVNHNGPPRPVAPPR